MPLIPCTKLREQHSGPLKYIAVGDSYTMGDGVKIQDSFPYQLVKELKRFYHKFSPPKIIAQTGWTARELRIGIEEAGISGKKYDLVTLMIGINNQYRGESPSSFKQEFS